MEMLIWIVLGLFALALIIFPEFRNKLIVLIRGGLNVFIEYHNGAKGSNGA